MTSNSLITVSNPLSKIHLEKVFAMVFTDYYRTKRMLNQRQRDSLVDETRTRVC